MKKLSTYIIMATLTASAHAQNGINSPYSRYGFGIQSDRAMGFNKGMGGVAQGFRQGEEINIANPASYSEVDSITALFDIGLSLQNGNYKMGDVQKNVRNSSFDYFAFQFRAKRNVGVTVGIMPITNIKYSLTSSSETLQGTEDVSSYYNFGGDGGLREAYIGAGWRPFKPVSVGFNLSYLWGEYSHSMSMRLSESNAYDMARVYSADISTYNVQGGIQYIQPLNKQDKIVLGATYTLGHDVANKAIRNTETLNGSYIVAKSSDTINNAFQMPHSVAAGLTYYRGHTLRVGADFELQKWSKCKFPNQQTDGSVAGSYTSSEGQLYDRTKIAAGLDWTPDPYGFKRGYFQHCTYKVGGYYSQSYAKADATGTVTDKPYEFGVAAGITMPIANKHTWQSSPRINVSLQWVHTNIPYLSTSTMQQGTLNENYLKLCIGVTFSERWFYKWKVQ